MSIIVDGLVAVMCAAGAVAAILGIYLMRRLARRSWTDWPEIAPGTAVGVNVAAALLTLFGCAVLGLGVSIGVGGPSRPSRISRSWAPCPRSEAPMALGPAVSQIISPSPHPAAQLGIAHIDSVISPDGGARVSKLEKVCLTVVRYPDQSRTLWLILGLRLPIKHPSYELFYAMGELSDPASGRYSIEIDRSCSAVPPGTPHTLVVVSADAEATGQLWRNYNAFIHNRCDATYDLYRHHLPPGTAAVSNQGVVIQR
jgi:hypothetical protein